MVDGKFRLEDMDSTNGTFVNGNRINAPVDIARDDAITLGKSTPMPWPSDDVISASERMITIGAADGNDVIVNEPVVSGHHARLTLCKGTWNLEDLGSTNGTFVGDKTNRIEKIPVAQDDNVFLGTYEV